MKKWLAALFGILILTPTLALAAEEPTGYLDVLEMEWYAEAVMEMTEQGLMQGTGEGYFNPGAPVSRATVIAVLWRLEEAPEVAGETGNFPDVDAQDPVSSWYASAAAWAKVQAWPRAMRRANFMAEIP